MGEQYYTLAMWRVREGETEAFVRAWRDELARAFIAAAPKARGMLVQSLQDPQLFYSFGPWETLEQMDAARADPGVRAAIGQVMALCDEATPGPYRVVLTVP